MISQLTRQPKSDSLVTRLAISFVRGIVNFARFLLRLASLGDKADKR